MPLWLSPFRFRTSRWPTRSRISSSSFLRSKWQRIPYLRSSYNTVSRENQHDEIRAPTIPTSSEAAKGLRSSARSGPPIHDPPPERRNPHYASLRNPPKMEELQTVPTQSTSTVAARNHRKKTPKSSATQQTFKGAIRAQTRKVVHPHQTQFVTRRTKVIGQVKRPANHHTRTEAKTLSIWTRQLSRIYTNVRLWSDEDWFKYHFNPITDVRAAEWSERLLERLDGDDGRLSRLEMSSYDNETGYVWVQVALWLLANDPRSMIRFLLATHVEPYYPETFIESSLAYLSKYWAFSRDEDSALQLQQLADAFCVLADREEGRLTFFNPFFRTLIRHCSDEQIQTLYRTIKSHNVSTHWNTYLHFATYFAKHGHFSLALDALMDAKDAGAEMNSYGFRSNCSTILRKSSEHPDGLRECLRIVSNLVDIGVELDKPIFDIIMLNAVEAGDLKTAWGVYHSLLERGLQPTESTFAVLLKGCKMNIDDAETLNGTIRDAIANMKVRESELVATEILHCLALHHSRHNPSTALNTLIDAYAEFFDLRPLQKLGLTVPIPSQQPDEFMAPPRHVLNFIIGATIDQHLSRDAPPENILALYSRWRTHVEAGEPSLAPLAAYDHTSNLFLQAFIQHPSGLIHATRVVRDMQRALPASAGEVQQIAPTVQTWSIFLHGFTRHGKIALAEQVLQYMRSKSVEPNHVTWNTLVTGYARVQDEVGVVQALRRAEATGMVWDRWTHGGLGALRKRELLEDELEKSRLRKSLDFGGELRQELGARLAGMGDARQEEDVESEVKTTEVSQYRPF